MRALAVGRTAASRAHAPSLRAVVVSVTKDGVKFSTSGDIGSANITCRQNTAMDKARAVRPHMAIVARILTRLFTS